MVKLNKNKIKKDDGRYLIYYTFDNEENKEPEKRDDQ